MKPEEYASYDALGLRKLLEAGEVGPGELHDAAVASIERLNPVLNFLTSTSPDEAAKALADLDLQAPFAGLPFLMKEGVGMAGQAAFPCCRLSDGMVCESDSEFVRRLKRTGVVTLGSTNAPELANSFTTESILKGPARNPWNIGFSTGGSSGGAAAAVAAGVVPVAQGGDGAGSIRVPAHCCGVFGLTPSRGRNPVGPNWYGGIFGIGRKHVLTRSVRDSAAMLDQLHGPEAGALHRAHPPARPFLKEIGSEFKRLRVAFSTRSPSGHRVDPACIQAVTAAARLCEKLGHEVGETSPTYDWDRFLSAFYDYWAFGYAPGIARAQQATGRSVGPANLEKVTLALVDRAAALTPERINQFITELFVISRDIEPFFGHWDVLMTPVCLSPAPPLGILDDLSADVFTFDRMLSEFAPYTAIFNISGQPSMSVPLYQSKEGLPIGVLCTARIYDEATLIQLAAQFEEACPWIDRRPPVGVRSPQTVLPGK
jgi:amidase